MKGQIQYQFTAILWQQPSTGGWQFVSLPEDISTEIRALLKSSEEGWGRLKATAKIGNTKWETAIWFDTKRNTYLLPLKAIIRTNENITLNQEIAVIIWV
jgi:Domain of unknown function (DUF1905)